MQAGKQMKNRFLKQKKLIWIICITALAIAMGCVFATCSSAQAEVAGPVSASPDGQKADVAAADAQTDSAKTAEDNYSRWLNSHYSAKIYTQEMWLTDLLKALYPSDGNSIGDQTVFAAAYRHGLIDSAEGQPYSSLTRRYVAQTLFNAFGYQAKKCTATDLDRTDVALSTLVYYGFFIPDENGKVYPDAAITGEEYQQLLEELRRYKSLNGKTVLSFGDSIMYGRGNNDNGIADMICEKYGMRSIDHSVSGATFAEYPRRNVIPAQIESASKMDIDPDIILINGGTNDMEFIPYGRPTDGYDAQDFDKKTYAGGFEYAAYLLQHYWQDTPVIYIRAHNMATVDDAKEREYGELAITLSEKWRMNAVDIYNDTDFSTENPEIRDAYTIYKKRLGHADGIHPTALGYAKFYLPLICAELAAILA